MPKNPQKYPSEGQVVNSCMRYLIMRGCFVWRNNTGAYKPEGSNRYIRYGCKGSPDIIGMTPSGRFIGIECKTGRNKPTDLQKAFGEKMTEHGGLYIVAYGVDDLIKYDNEMN